MSLLQKFTRLNRSPHATMKLFIVARYLTFNSLKKKSKIIRVLNCGNIEQSKHNADFSRPQSRTCDGDKIFTHAVKTVTEIKRLLQTEKN